MNDEEKRKVLQERAENEPRDEFGRFVKEDPTEISKTKTTKIPHITQHTETKGAGNLLERLIHVEHDKEENNETLIDVKVSNPLHRIIEILQDIKKHQATTISLRFTIPLIALPIALFVFFKLGEAQSACNTYTATTLGVLKRIPVLQNTSPTHFYTPLLDLIPFYTPTSETKETKTSMRTVVITPQGDTLTLLHKASFDLNSLQNRQVLATGQMNSCHKTLSIEFPENIALY